MAEAPGYGWNIGNYPSAPAMPADQEAARGDPVQCGKSGTATDDVMMYNVQEVPPSEEPPPYPLPPPEAPPPSYDSLFGRAKAAKEASSGIAGFFSKFFEIACVAFLGSIGIAIIYGLLLALPTAMIVIGAIHLYDCPVERYIPIYLIVGGSSWLLWQVFVFKPGKKKKKNKKKNNESGEVEEGTNNSPVEAGDVQPQVPVVHSHESVGGATIKQALDTLTAGSAEEEKDDSKDDENASCPETTLVCFIIAWFIAGNVWVYRTTTSWQGEDPNAIGSYCHPLVYNFSFWLITGTYILFACIFTCMSACGFCCK